MDELMKPRSSTEEIFSKFIDDEINQLHADIQRPGWTIWALIGGISTIAWLLSIELEKQDIDFSNIAFVLKIMTYSLLAVALVHTFLHSHKKITSDANFHLTNQLFSKNRIPLFLLIGWWLFMFAPDDLPFYKILFVNMVAGTVLSGLVIIFIASWFRFPYPRQMSFSRGYYVWLSFFLICSIYIFVQLQRDFHTDLTIVEARIASMIAALFILLLMLSMVPKSSVILNTLSSIRRDWILGKISFNDVQQQTDIALSGLGTMDIFHEYIGDYLNIIGKLEEEFVQLNEEFTRRSIFCLAERELTSAEIQEDEELTDSIGRRYKKIGELLEDTSSSIDKNFKPIRKRIRFLALFFQIDREFITSMKSKYINASDSVKMKWEVYDKNYEEVKAKCRATRGSGCT